MYSVPARFTSRRGWVSLSGLGVLVTPPIFTFAESLHWMVRLSAVVLFLVFTFVFSWFYHRQPVYYCIVILLLYLESYCIIPMVLKWQRRRTEKLRGD